MVLWTKYTGRPSRATGLSLKTYERHDRRRRGFMWGALRREREALGLAGVGVHASGLSFVQVQRAARGPIKVTAAEFRPFAGAEPQKVLARLVLDYDLKHRRCTTLLGDGEYRLIQTEAPDVKSDEMKAALRWRIKDLIDFHVNDATIDVFDVPVQTPGRPALVYVVVGRNEAIRKRVDLMQDAGAALDIIDIPELAQRNLAWLLPQDQEGVALLTLSDGAGLITITRGGELYLSRTIAATPNTQDEEASFSRLLLELQRSLDYFESSFRQNPIMNVVVAPRSPQTTALAAFLKANLAQRVVAWEDGRYGDIDVPVPIPDACWLTLGAALREDKVVL
ncbi:MAG: type IV pilus biogenesis protein PilM [Acidiferrobacter sp.]